MTLEKLQEVMLKIRKRVTSLPTKPKPGAVFLTKLTKFDPPQAGHNISVMQGLDGKVAVPSVRVSLGGKTGVVAGSYDHYAVRELVVGRDPNRAPRPPSESEVLKWLSDNTDLKNRVNTARSLEEYTPAGPRTRDNTGHCAVCLQNVKVRATSGLPEIVLHGYKRPGCQVAGTTPTQSRGSSFSVGLQSCHSISRNLQLVVMCHGI